MSFISYVFYIFCFLYIFLISNVLYIKWVYGFCRRPVITDRDLPKGKACGSDDISAELLHGMGEKGLQLMISLINKIYKSGYIPEDFRKSIFVPIPKVSKAQKCSDFYNNRSDISCIEGFATSNKKKNNTNNWETTAIVRWVSEKEKAQEMLFSNYF